MKTKLYNSVFCPKLEECEVHQNSTCLDWFLNWVFILKTQKFEFESWKLKNTIWMFLNYRFQWPPPLYAKNWIIERRYAPRYKTKQVIFRVSEKKIELEMSYGNWVCIMRFELWVILNQLTHILGRASSDFCHLWTVFTRAKRFYVKDCEVASCMKNGSIVVYGSS